MINFSGTSASVDVDWDPTVIQQELKNAVLQLSAHGFKLAAKWASEQLVGISSTNASSNINDTGDVAIGAEETKKNDDVDDDDDEQKRHVQFPSKNAGTTMPEMSPIEMYAKSLMDLGEYAHAAAVLSQPSDDVTVIMPPQNDLSSFGICIRGYALYMAGEARKSHQDLELKSPLDDRRSLRNPFLEQLRLEFRVYYEQRKLNAYGLYVYGLVLKESLPLKGEHSPHLILLESLRAQPWNWSAWLDLASLPNNNKVVQEQLRTELGAHCAYHFYAAHVLQQSQNHREAISIQERLLSPPVGIFGASPYLASQLAVAHYHLREFSVAEHCFQQIHARDPHRLEDMDIYSNILYVQDNGVALGRLAHTAVKVDKYRPETCCVVGNYYSLKQMRTKAITYFQRALKLDPHYTGAWTLMGHEYIECKNTPAAMEAYREAANRNKKDYRAWYGLGQAYEILGMPLYALYYYRRACSIRAYDPRMWSAVAGCYLALGKKHEAILCFEKAMQDDVEGIATTQLAQLYKEANKTEQAAQCYRKHLELRYLATNTHPSTNPTFEEILQGVVVQATEAIALLFLAHYHKSHGELETATLCASRLLEYPGPEREEGKAVLREIKSRTAIMANVTTRSGRDGESGAAVLSPRRRRRQEEADVSVEFSP